MTQFQQNAQTDGRTEWWEDGQTLFYKTLLATTGGPITVETNCRCLSLTPVWAIKKEDCLHKESLIKLLLLHRFPQFPLSPASMQQVGFSLRFTRKTIILEFFPIFKDSFQLKDLATIKLKSAWQNYKKVIFYFGFTNLCIYGDFGDWFLLFNELRSILWLISF